MPPLKRFFLKLHVRLCVFCGKFNRQVMESQDMCRCYKENEEAILLDTARLDAKKKDELKQILISQSQGK